MLGVMDSECPVKMYDIAECVVSDANKTLRYAAVALHPLASTCGLSCSALAVHPPGRKPSAGLAQLLPTLVRHARPFTPSMFMAQLPQMPSLHVDTQQRPLAVPEPVTLAAGRTCCRLHSISCAEST